MRSKLDAKLAVRLGGGGGGGGGGGDDNDAPGGASDVEIAFLAAAVDDAGTLEAVLQRGVDPVGCVNGDGFTLLMVATLHDSLEVVR